MTPRSYLRRPSSHPAARDAAARQPTPAPWSVPDLCAAYEWPTGLRGGGTIAIVELGGGWTKSDLDAYFGSLRQPAPSVIDVSVDGTQNSPGQEADAEVALDIQIAAASYFAATGHPAQIRVYWARDIAAAVRAATADGCDTCSISWGADEAEWGREAALHMEAAVAAAAAAGMIVFAASGDNDSSDGGPGAANVDLPAACPSAIGCGGTLKGRVGEVVWNDTPGDASGSGTGGGYSTLFAMPAWQASGGAPAGPGRMVPDVAANAAPGTGYEIYCQGRRQIVGGTSAVSPLYAGLLAAFGTKLGAGAVKKLWTSVGAFVDVAQGDNGMFRASVGPDPCTGLGVPIGRRIGTIFGADGPSVEPPVKPPLGPPVSVTLDQAFAWASSALPHATMTRETVLKFVARGLREHWPVSAPVDAAPVGRTA